MWLFIRMQQTHAPMQGLLPIVKSSLGPANSYMVHAEFFLKIIYPDVHTQHGRHQETVY